MQKRVFKWVVIFKCLTYRFQGSIVVSWGSRNPLSFLEAPGTPCALVERKMRWHCLYCNRVSKTACGFRKYGDLRAPKGNWDPIAIPLDWPRFEDIEKKDLKGLWSGKFFFIKIWAIVPRRSGKKKNLLGTYFVFTIFISFSRSVIVFSGLATDSYMLQQFHNCFPVSVK